MIKAIVIDDEIPAINKMVNLLEKSNKVEILGTFTDPLEALRFLEITTVDTVFLDIEMPQVNGLELSSRIMDLQEKIVVIFVTAYNQYAVEAFELHALDYLMKPVTAARLQETLKRIVPREGSEVVTPAISVICFGRFAVYQGSNQVKFRTEKAEELLAFMIDHGGEFISRSEILDQLWGDFDGERALIHFNTTLHYVKKALSAYGSHIPFQYDRGGYVFDIQGMNCDFLKVFIFLKEKKPLEQSNLWEFEEIAEILQKEYLSGRDYEWVMMKRIQLEEKYFHIILEIADYYKGIAEYKKAAAWLKGGLKKEAIHREINVRLIEVLLLDHDRILAVKYYDVYRKNLKKHTGQEPDSVFVKLLHSGQHTREKKEY